MKKKLNIKFVVCKPPSKEAIDRLNTALLNMILRYPDFKPPDKV